ARDRHHSSGDPYRPRTRRRARHGQRRRTPPSSKGRTLSEHQSNNTDENSVAAAKADGCLPTTFARLRVTGSFRRLGPVVAAPLRATEPLLALRPRRLRLRPALWTPNL